MTGRSATSENKPPRMLSEQSIVRAARAIVDEGGLRALTMRRLADELDVALGATYHYVPSRQALIRLVAHDIFREFELPDRGHEDWAERVFDCIVRFRDHVGRYPGFANEISRDPLGFAPASLQAYIRETLSAAGFSLRDLADVMTTLYFFTTGATLPLDSPGVDPVFVEMVDARFQRGLRLIIRGAEQLLSTT